MLYEKHFECKTRGIVQGQDILTTYLPVSATNLYSPKPFDLENINRKEFFVNENLFDIRKDSTFNLSWKVVIRSRETGETLWVRAFSNKYEADLVYIKLIGLDMERLIGSSIDLPGVWQDGDFEYQFATVQSYTATGTTTWTAPGGVTQTDYLVVAGGGSGGGGTGGGGGAGGYRTATGFAVTPGNGYTVTVGDGGAAATGYLSNNGANSVFGTITSNGGGGGGSNFVNPVTGLSGGSGGGGSGPSGAGGAGNTPATSPSQGNNGGASGYWSNPYTSGGGGGASAVGADSTSTSAGKGGDGSSSSISGSSVTYAGGGGGGAFNLTNGGAGGSGGGGTGAGSSTANATAGATNTGGGGGAGGQNITSSWAGGSGIVILSYTTAAPIRNFGFIIG